MVVPGLGLVWGFTSFLAMSPMTPTATRPPALPVGWPKSSAFSWTTTPRPRIEVAPLEAEGGVEQVVGGVARVVGFDVAEVADVPLLGGRAAVIHLGG